MALLGDHVVHRRGVLPVFLLAIMGLACGSLGCSERPDRGASDGQQAGDRGGVGPGDGGGLPPPERCKSGQVRPFEPQPAHPRIFLTTNRLARARSHQQGNTPTWRELLRAYGNGNGVVRAADGALLYVVTGEASYATKARSDVLAYCASENGFSRDVYRADVQDVALVFDWIHDKLSAADRKTLVGWMMKASDNHWKSVIEAQQATDSDALTAGAKTALLIAVATSGDNDRAASWHDAAIKLWDVGAEDYLSQLQSIKGTFIPRSAGGLWMEGTSYSPNTVRYVYEMADAELSATGRDLLCEVKTQTGRDFLREPALAMVQLQIPGYTDGFTWGDLQNPEWPMQPERWVGLAAFAIEALGDDPVARWAHHFLEHGPTNVPDVPSLFLGALHGQQNVESRVVPLYEQGTAEPPASLPLTHVAPGPGVVIARTSNDASATGVWLQPGSFHRVDHVHFDAGSFQVFRRGEWLTREVRGYGLWANTTRAHNSILLDGIGPQELMAFEYGEAKVAAQCEHSSYVYAAGDLTTAFNVDPARNTHSGPPADRAAEAIRQFVFLRPQGWLVVFDRLEVKKTTQKKELIFLTMSQPAVAGGVITSKSIRGSNKTSGARQEGTQTMQIATVFPQQGMTYTTVQEASYYKTPRPELGLNGPATEWEIATAERRWHVLAKLPGTAARETALHVLWGLDTGQAAPKVEPLEASGKQGVRIQDGTGGAEILFNVSGPVGGSFTRSGTTVDLSTCK